MTSMRILLVVLLFSTIACSERDTAADRTPGAPIRASAPAEQRGPEAASAGAVPSNRSRIVFLGDSLTAGLGLDRSDATTSLVQARLDAGGYSYEVVNAGVSGDTSAGGLRRLDWSLDGNVRVLVVELGANDGLRGLPVSEMKQNLSRI